MLQFVYESEAVIALVARRRDGGGANFGISLDRRQELTYALSPAFFELWVGYLAITDNVVDNLHAQKISNPPHA